MGAKPKRETVENLAAMGKTPAEFTQAIKAYAEERGVTRAAAHKAISTQWFGKEVRREEMKPQKCPPAPVVDIEAFGGRTATMAEIVEFVAGRVLVGNVKPEDCPDPRAYTYWWWCHNDQDFCKDFLKATAVKLMPSRVAPETVAGVGDFDGNVQVETIDAILKAKAVSEEIIAG